MRLIATFVLLTGIVVLGAGCKGQPSDSDNRPPVRQKIENNPNNARPVSPAITDELNQPSSQEFSRDTDRQSEKAAPLNLPDSQPASDTRNDFSPPVLPDKDNPSADTPKEVN
ncbi:hypothetical protein Pan153_52450 [Gimesia panareensis]|uniref:Lipoprotein n=1 Tax=Gimesia panareensis TaxID=2527978 RepID=A0A518FW45_9PLAN|nr:hypothetical protein [Gimesia panareensis]QDV20569.1 hypothetical protein Pan153_52450 [Gimesia panareensis]